MKIHVAKYLLIFSAALSIPSAWGTENVCTLDIEKAKSELGSTGKWLLILSAFKDPFNLPPKVCKAAEKSFGLVYKTKTKAGRKLEEDRPMDLNGAAQERKEASSNPEYVATLRNALALETDSNRRLLVEAAMLHAYGHYQARDMLLDQISAGVAP